MQIFNEEFIAILQERGLRYINSLKDYESILKENNPFKEDTRINSFYFEDCINDGNLIDLETDYGFIRIEFEEKEFDYCSRDYYWEERSVTLPTWILSESFEKKLELRIRDNIEKELNQKQHKKNSDLKKLKDLASEYGYELKEIK